MRARKSTKTPLIAIASMLALGGAAACSSDAGGDQANGEGGASAESFSIGFLMPDRGSTRYEEQDYPLFEARIQELCESCEVIYQNADGDANEQQAQAESMAAQGVDLVVLDAVDTTAAANTVQSLQASDIEVITYDRPVPDAEEELYVSFDNKELGRLIATDLVEHLEAEGNDPSDGGVLIVNGSPSDDAAMLIKEGINEGVETGDYPVLAEYDTPDWLPENAQEWVDQQTTEFSDEIIGVAAANDGTASGAIAALYSAGMDPIPPVTGNDAEIAAIQRIIQGEQYNTISKPIRIVAEATAEAAMELLTGGTPEADEELFGTPSQLYVPEVVTQDNVKEVMFDSGIYTADQVCTENYADACDELGIE